MRLSIACTIIFFAVVKGRRIAGGDVVSISEYPFATSLLSNIIDGTYQQSCGGTILTTSAILSAASCFHTDGDEHTFRWWRARVGSTNSNSGGTVHMINRITSHPDFSTSTLQNDIAVLRTTVIITFISGVVAAARIAGGAFTLTENQVVTAIGWGATSATGSNSEQLRQVEFWVTNQEICANRYQERNFVVTSNMVCVGWLDVGVRGQCQGDTGSPLIALGAVVGIYSWSEGCADSWYPSINTQVSPYTRWIVATATES